MISRLTCLDRRVSTRIIESIRTLTPEQHGLNETVLTRAVYAFGKWIMLARGVVDTRTSSQKVQVNVWTSATGAAWTKEQTIFEYGSFPNSPQVLLELDLQLAGGVLFVLGLRSQLASPNIQSNHGFFVLISDNGTAWNAIDLPTNTAIFPAYSNTLSLVNFYYINGLAVFRIAQTPVVWAKATAAANFQDLQTIPPLQVGGTFTSFQYFLGHYYGYTWTDTPYVATLARTQDFETFENVSFPYTTGRTFYLAGKFFPFLGLSFSPNFLWVATVEPDGAGYIVWIWRSMDAINWDPVQLPTNLRAAVSVTGDVSLALVQAGGSIVVRYDSSGYGFGSLVTTSYSGFMEIPNRGFVSNDKLVSPSSLYPAIIWYALQPSGLSNLNITP